MVVDMYAQHTNQSSLIKSHLYSLCGLSQKFRSLRLLIIELLVYWTDRYMIIERFTTVTYMDQSLKSVRLDCCTGQIVLDQDYKTCRQTRNSPDTISADLKGLTLYSAHAFAQLRLVSACNSTCGFRFVGVYLATPRVHCSGVMNSSVWTSDHAPFHIRSAA